MLTLPKSVHKLCKFLLNHHYRPVIVGGYVRDFFLHVDSKDIDIELYNVHDIDDVKKILSDYYSVNEVGRSFGVLKVVTDEYDIDISLPRTEVSSGDGHSAFDVTTHSNINFTEASRRRDFTCNAIGYDYQSSSFLDPYSGREAIKKRELSSVDDSTFVEDPLRLFRAIQFSARFNFTCNDKLKQLLQTMYRNNQLTSLTKERLFDEIKKLLLKSTTPSIGFYLMKEIGILGYFPEIDALVNVKQDPIYHAEGDVFIHTMMVIDVMKTLTCKKNYKEKEQLVFMFSALCHDFGKPLCTTIQEGKIRAIKHEIVGIQPTINFLEKLTNDKKLIEEVSNLVKHHLKVIQFYKTNVSDSAIRRLACEINIQQLTLLAEADYKGRVSLSQELDFRAGEWILQRAEALHVKDSKPNMLIQGRDLIALGLKPSKEFSAILHTLYEAQLDGKFTSYEEALAYLNNYFE